MIVSHQKQYLTVLGEQLGRARDMICPSFGHKIVIATIMIE
jgi:hypothetical protein